MEILAIESSTPVGSLALWRDGCVVARETFQSDRAHNSVLFAPLERILKDTGTLRCIVCGTGPGSYTGVRVGIAAAIGLSLARRTPLIGLASVLGIQGSRYAVCGDARRGSWWWTEVENGALIRPPSAMSLEDAAHFASEWQGAVYTVDAAAPPFSQAEPVAPDAGLLATRASALSDAEIAELAALAVEPLYLTAPFVTVSKKPVFA